MSESPPFEVTYVELPMAPAEPLPDEFSSSRLRRSLLVVGGIVLVVVAAIVLVPGLGSLRDRSAGAQPAWLVLAAVLQLGSCASYVLVFRAVFCREMSWLTSTEIGLPNGRRTPSSRSAEPAASPSGRGSCGGVGLRRPSSPAARSRSSC